MTARGEFDPAASLPVVFARQVATRPEAPAVVWSGGAWSYAMLDRVAAGLAAHWRARGLDRDEVVGLSARRTPETIAAMLAILRLGSAYLPLDPAWPASRLSLLCADAGVRCIVGGDLVPGLTVLSLEGPDPLSAAPDVAMPPGLGGDSRAYVMYTSGSTGMPKGVEICHRGVLRLVQDATFMRLHADTRMLQAAPLGFDASTLEIWGPLLNGGTCVLHDEAVPSGPGLARTVSALRVDSAWLTAALFNAVVDDDPRHLRGLKQLLVGGEALSVPHVCRALAALPDTVLVNGYGPTEATTFAATCAIPRDLPVDAARVPIGRAIQHTTLRILTPDGAHVVAGEAGELCIGGPGLARGYLGRPDLTAERFVADPHAPGERLYRTGDRVRQRPDGEIEYLGRYDDQVKIRGHRIEPGEVEAALQHDPAVRACAVVAVPDANGAARLVAYVVPQAVQRPPGPAQSGTPGPERPLAWHDLRARLARALPEPMLPSEVVFLAALPLTPSGKVDRRALPMPASPTRERPAAAGLFATPRDAAEQQACDVFAEVLGLDRVGRDDSFFELGGHSLLAVRAAARLAALTGHDVPPTVFYERPTPAGIATRLRRGPNAGAATTISPQVPAHPVSTAGPEPIAIVGMAVRLPGARDIEAFWQNLLAGRDSIRHFSDDELDPSQSPALLRDPRYVKARGVIDDVEMFDAGFFGLTPREAELTDPQHRVFLELCWECLERAGHPPDRTAGAIGVYAGTYNATYFQRHLAPRPDRIEALGEFQVMLANEKDYIATRVAHRLDLTGPAVSVHTACSTSLVAMAQAVLALRSGQCDLALAGGASVTCPPMSGHLHEDGGMLSRDGHTRSFAADASGTVFSDGAGVVLLRRLSDAIADGDTVHAVIRGIAVNNDGRGKASFTAPSVAGQARVIAAALADARVEPRSLSYVEAHGTATPLGDPVEVEALAQAWRAWPTSANAAPWCALGSVKSNIGHTVTAAGVAGVVKTALALSHERLPATLHVAATHPAIDFDATPFFVAREARDWPRSAVPRRAGVSAFGVGGTNAHAILEEAPAPAPREPLPRDRSHVLRLSARTPAALHTLRLQLADHLDRHPALRLDDVAHTLRVGRSVFPHRAVVVAADAAEASRQLRAGGTPGLASPVAEGEPQVVFAFPGQGAQYAGMGRALAARLPVFRDAFDAALDAMDGEAPVDLRAVLAGDDAAALARTAWTQPALFAVGHALAATWRALGVNPVASVGHSVGEFVAAVQAGVMSLADAARLVAVRGRLMQALEPGAMLSVRLSAAQVARRLPGGLSIAAENGPRSTVVSGPLAAIAAFRTELEALGEPTRVLDASHAFHSAMMDPVLEPFEAAVRSVTLHAPQQPIVSTLTGERLKDEEATDPRYWARHLREPVWFAAALRSIAAAWPRALLLECGPGSVLTRLSRQPVTGERPALAPVASLPVEAGTAPDEIALLQRAAGELWIAGQEVDGTLLEPGRGLVRVVLPTHPLDRRRHWVDAPAYAGSPAGARADLPAPAARTEPTPAAASGLPARTGDTVTTDRLPRLVAELRALFEHTSGVEMAAVPVDAVFVEAGLDSLTLTQVALQLRRAYGVELTFRQLMSELGSLGRLAAALDERLAPDAANAHAAATEPPAAHAPTSPPAGDPTGATLALLQQQMALISQQLALLGAAAPVAAYGPAAATTAAAPRALGPTPTPATAAAGAAPVDKPVTTYDVKTAFGAIARIHGAGGDALTARQRARLDALVRRYTERTAGSKAYTARHRPHLADPRVVNGFRPLLKEITYQIVMERSKGAWLWDVDGNAYVDALNGFGMSLFGWQPDFVQQAVRAQLERGYEIGPQHVLAGEVARLVCEMTGFDRAGLCNTGSEAVMGCMRIARTVTGRGRIALFAGSYHGIFDEVIVRGTKTLRSVPAAPGIMPSAMENVVVLDYGTPEALAWIEAHAGELAAVLVEPVQSRRPDLQPREFLHELRAITERTGTLLVFDEVVTGFRCHPQGAQGLFEVRADLAAYGKVVGGGFSIGIIAGRRAYADALDGGHWTFGDDSTPNVGVTYFAGTFVRHPIALAAAKAVLERLAAEGPELQSRLTASTAAMVDALNAHCREVGAPIVLKSFASLWRVVFLEDHPLQDLLFAMMRSRGVHILDNFPCFLTTAHTPADIATIEAAFRDSVAELQEAEFLPRRPVATMLADARRPPVPNARLGRDKEGRPAWFVPDPVAPGRFVKVDG